MNRTGEISLGVRPSGSREDISMSSAIALLCIFVVGLWFVVDFKGFKTWEFSALERSIEVHKYLWGTYLFVLIGNVTWIGATLERFIGLKRQGAKLRVLKGEGAILTHRLELVISIVGGYAIFLGSGHLGIQTMAESVSEISGEMAHGFFTTTWQLNWGLLIGFVIYRIARRLRARARKIRWPLELPKKVENQVILGTLNEEEALAENSK